MSSCALGRNPRRFALVALLLAGCVFGLKDNRRNHAYRSFQSLERVESEFASTASGDCNGCGAALTSLLSGVSIKLPTIEPAPISYGLNSVVLRIYDLVCGDFVVGDIDVASAADNVELTASGIELSCNGKVFHENKNFPHLPGTTDLAAKSTGSSADLKIDYQFDSDFVPVGLVYEKCHFGLSLDVHLSGDIVGALADFLVGILKGFIEPAIGDLICGQLKDLINKNGTALLATVASGVHEYLHIEPHVDNPPLPETEVVDFYSLRPVLKVADELIRADGSNGIPVVNNALNLLTNNTGEFALQNLSLAVQLGDDGLTSTNITIQTIALSGLSSFEKFDILQNVEISGYPGNYSLAFDVELKYLGLYVDGSVSLAPGSIILHNKGKMVLNASGVLGLHDLKLHMVMQLLISKNDLENFKLGQIINSPAGCIATLIKGTNATLVDVHVSSFDVPQIQGFAGVSPLFNEIIYVLNDMFGRVSLDVLHGAFATKLKTILNDLVNGALKNVSANADTFCPAFAQADDGSFVNFTLSKVLQNLRSVLDLFGIDSAISFNVNWIIDILTKFTGGVFFPGHVLGFETKAGAAVGLDEIRVNLSNIGIRNLDQFHQLDLLKPVDSYILESSIGIGGLLPGNPFNLSLDICLDLKGSAIKHKIDDRFYDSFTIWLAASNLSTDISTEIEIMSHRIQEMTVRELLNLKQLCALSAVHELSFSALDLWSSVMDLGVNCKDCRSPKFLEWSRMLSNPEASLQLTSNIQSLFSFLQSEKALDRINGIIAEKLPGLVGDQCGQSKPEVDVLAAQNLIPDLPSHSEIPTTRFMQILWTSCAAGCILVLLAVYYPLMRTKSEEPSKQKLIDNDVNVPALGYDPRVSNFSKFWIPFLIMAHLLLFVTSNTSNGASVFVTLSVAGDRILLPPLFNFSLANSVSDMWKAKVYPLALLIACFSGAWPYIKGLLLLACWIAPPKYWSAKARAKSLHWLDILGKWSLVDNYVLVLMMVAFRFHIATPDQLQYLPPEMLIADVIVLPGWGIFGFIIAAIVQLILTHWIIKHDRKISELEAKKRASKHQPLLADKVPTEKEPEFAPSGVASPPSSAPSSVMRQSSSRINSSVSEFPELPPLMDDDIEKPLINPDEVKLSERHSDSQDVCSTPTFQLTFAGKQVVLLLLLLAVGFTGFGAFVNSFKFVFHGAAGWVLGERRVHSYSLVSVASLLLSPKFGLLFLWFIFLLFALIVPLLQLLTLMFVWVVPLSGKSQKKLLFLAEVFRAMGALEVFIVAIIAALYELRQFVGFIIGDKCDVINKIIADYFHGSFGDEDVCFDVTASLDTNCWVLLVGAALSLLATWIVFAFSDSSEDDAEANAREERIKRAIGSNQIVADKNKWSIKLLLKFCLLKMFEN